KTGRVGELPTELEAGTKLHPAPDEAEFIATFCQNHRRIASRRIVALSALRLEIFRQQKGSFPKTWKHTVPGGSELSLDWTGSPCLKLVDRQKEIKGAYPEWLGPLNSPATIDYTCPLNPAPEISKR
ncbi:MAG TPA: hypothetical protein VGE67_15545, partial [Haloferula sp.]